MGSAAIRGVSQAARPAYLTEAVTKWRSAGTISTSVPREKSCRRFTWLDLFTVIYSFISLVWLTWPLTVICNSSPGSSSEKLWFISR